MSHTFRDWYRRDPPNARIAIALACLIALILLLFSGFVTAAERIKLTAPLTWQDRDTYTMGTNASHQLCWGDGNASPDLRIDIYRYRAEDSLPRVLVVSLLKSSWTPPVPPITTFCMQGFRPPRTGHWIYEAEICTLAPASLCSDTVTTACAAGSGPGCAGAVGDTPRGWWMYVFLAAPTGVGT